MAELVDLSRFGRRTISKDKGSSFSVGAFLKLSEDQDNSAYFYGLNAG
jgi:hypothetical protein